MIDLHLTNKRIGAAIRAARSRRGIKQDELAPRLGVGRTTVARYETGQRTLSAAMLVHICQVLNESLDSLLPGLITVRSTPTAALLPSAVQRIVQQLQHHPELVPLVEDLLETLSATEADSSG